MSEHPVLRLDAAALERFALPDIPYPVPLEVLQQAVGNDGGLPLEEMLCALQAQIAYAADWQTLEPALERLAALVAPADTRESVAVEGDDWWLELGPVDLGACLVTIQRGDCLLAAIVPRADGRLRAAVYRPLDADSIQRLFALGRVPHPVHGVSMGRRNWEFALDASCGAGQFHAAHAGRSYLSYWAHGLGVSGDRSHLPVWHAQRGLAPRPVGLVATELGIHYCLADLGHRG